MKIEDVIPLAYENMYPDETGIAVQALIRLVLWVTRTGCMQSARSTLSGKIIDHNGSKVNRGVVRRGSRETSIGISLWFFYPLDLTSSIFFVADLPTEN